MDALNTNARILLRSSGTFQARDGAMLLSHQRPYREFPLEWVTATLQRHGIEVVRNSTFSSTLGISYIRRQLKWVRCQNHDFNLKLKGTA
jgi:hypothetical protein